jgi:hypothetical protein
LPFPLKGNPLRGELDESFGYESCGSELSFSVSQHCTGGNRFLVVHFCPAAVSRYDLGCLAYEHSAAHQPFHSRDQDAYEGVSQKTVMNPVPGKPENQENVA